MATPQRQLLPLRDADADTAPAKQHRVRTGKACRRCANIKCKCIRPAEGLPCERCRRLKATCEPALPASAQRAATSKTGVRAAPRSRTARLEARIDDLVNLLQAPRTQPQLQPPLQTQTQAGALVTPHSPASLADSGVLEEGTSSTPGRPSHGSKTDSPVHRAAPPGYARTGTGTSTAATTPADADPYQDNLTQQEAESRLCRFRDDMLPLAPFHYIPPTTTAAEIRQKSPFLWLCIRVVADPSPVERTRLALVCQRVITRLVVEEGERSLEILFGLLAFLSWNNLPFHGAVIAYRRFITLLSQVAIAVAWDLGLTTPPPPSIEPGPVGVTPGRYIGLLPTAVRRSESIDEWRAVLGVFLVTHSVSQKYRSADGLQWSPYLATCLAQLERYSTVPQDASLVQIIKMHHLASQVAQTPTADPAPQHSTGSPAPDGPRSIPVPFIESLRAELDAIVRIGPDGTSESFDNFTVHNLYHFTMLALHETILFSSPPSQTAGQPPSLWAISGRQRFEMYQRCIRSTKSVMDAMFDWPLEKYAALPSSSLMLLCPLFRCLYRLTTIRDSVWSPETARAVVDPIASLDRIIERCRSFSAMHLKQSNPEGPDAGHGRGNIVDIMSFSVARFIAFKRAWQSDLAAHTQAADAGNTVRNSGASDGNETDATVPTTGPGGVGSIAYPLPTSPGMEDSSLPNEMPLSGDDFSFLFADGMQNFQLDFDFGNLLQADPSFLGLPV